MIKNRAEYVIVFVKTRHISIAKVRTQRPSSSSGVRAGKPAGGEQSSEGGQNPIGRRHSEHFVPS